MNGFTFHFSSYTDPSHSTSSLNPTVCKWGVCIAIRNGLAYQPVQVKVDIFAARVLHGKLVIPTFNEQSIIVDIMGVYAPAQEDSKPAFWEQLTTYTINIMKKIQHEPNRYLVMGGDWNSYLDPERDIYRTRPMKSAPSKSTDLKKTGHLADLMCEHNENNLYLQDPMARDKLNAFDSFTFVSSSQNFRSILDKLFTTISTDHIETSRILDWDEYELLSLSDHRAVITQINLRSLCEGWVEFPSDRFTNNPTGIRLDRITAEQTKRLKQSLQEWRLTLPTEAARFLLHEDKNNASIQASPSMLAELHIHLTDLFVDQPAKALNSGQYKNWKPRPHMDPQSRISPGRKSTGCT
jgi:hypothetical protein